MKPEMPEVKPTLQVGNITATLAHDFDKYSNGTMSMRVADCGGKITDDDGKELGSIYGCIGAGLAVSIGSRQWNLNMMEIWRAVRDAEEKSSE